MAGIGPSGVFGPAGAEPGGVQASSAGAGAAAAPSVASAASASAGMTTEAGAGAGRSGGGILGSVAEMLGGSI
eukprot:5307213-Alexandrium_andersonii.AAC.1